MNHSHEQLIKAYIEECFDIIEAGNLALYKHRFNMSYMAKLAGRPPNAYTRAKRTIPPVDINIIKRKFTPIRHAYEDLFLSAG